MQSNIDHYIKPEDAVTLHGLFLERVKRTPGAIAYLYFDTQQDVWVSLTWAQMLDEVARWQTALLREKPMAGDRVAIMLRNCPQWVAFEQAAMSLGLVVVPLYTVDRPDNIAYIVNDAQVKVLLFETDDQWQALRTVIGQLGSVQRLVSLDRIAGHDEPRLDAARRTGCLRRPKWDGSACATAMHWPPSCTPRAPPASPRA